MLESAASLLSIWSSMNSWLTPAVLFLVLNLMIGTIAVTSAFSSPKPHHHQPPPPQLQTQLTRSSSVLQRLQSLNLYSYIHSSLTLHHHQPPPSSTADLSPPPEEEEVVAKEDEGPTLDENEVDDEEGPTLDENEVDVEEVPDMDEVYSLIVNKSSNSAHYGRQKSDTKPTGGELPVRLPRKIKKSATVNSAFAHFDNAVADIGAGEDGGVDEMAADFITKFKHQLHLQRQESLYAANNNIDNNE